MVPPAPDHNCCWEAGEVMACAEHEACLVTAQSCRWPGCRSAYRELHAGVFSGKELAWP